MTTIRSVSAVGALALAASAFAATTTFENGLEGWSGPSGNGGATSIQSGGNPGNALRTVFNDFGVTFSNSTNTDFIRDLSSFDQVTFSVDVRVNSIFFFSQEVSRPWLVEFRDFNSTDPFYPWDSAWYLLTPELSQANNSEWTTFSVTFDATSAALPAGWNGYGAEDPNTFEPILPPNRSFTDIMGTYDEIAITTLQPGFFFGFTDHDLLLDNITLTAVPTPGAVALLGAAGLVGLRRRR
jgi:MYXO-CTERM domain-containing protein